MAKQVKKVTQILDAQTARAVGDTSLFTFSHRFKRFTGVRPSQYRQTSGGGMNRQAAKFNGNGGPYLTMTK